MTSDPVLVSGAGAVCSIGIGIAQVASSVRTGLSRFAKSSVYDRQFEPMTMALLQEAAFGDLVPSLEDRGLTSRVRRMLRLAAPALRQAAACADQGTALPLFLGLPEGYRERPPPAQASFLESLRAQAGVDLDVSRSQVFPNGRAAALVALDSALRWVAEHRAETVIVGGVDTFLDLILLSDLDRDERILGDRVIDGLTPGEGAAFLVLRPWRSTDAGPVILGTGTASDRGHRFSTEPAKGEGLSDAIEKMFSSLATTPGLIQRTFASLNGESFGGKEWGVARLRHTEFFHPAAEIVHPADCFGDTGAASGALLLALAQYRLARREAAGPVLVWASSDGPDRGCACLDLLAS